jgi:hypothetical protein
MLTVYVYILQIFSTKKTQYELIEYGVKMYLNQTLKIITSLLQASLLASPAKR